MFTIQPMDLESVRREVERFAERIPDVWRFLNETSSGQVETGHPFVQLSHHEIEEADVDAVLGYASITQANKPIGLPLTFETVSVGESKRDEILLYALDQLEKHIQAADTSTAAAYDDAGSLDEYLRATPDAAPRQYLVAGVIACIRFCRQHKHALSIRW